MFDKHSTYCNDKVFTKNLVTGTQPVYIGSETAHVRAERTGFMTRSDAPVAPVPPNPSITYYAGYNSLWIPKFGQDSFGGYFANFSFLPVAPTSPFCDTNKLRYDTYDVANLTQICVNYRDRSNTKWNTYSDGVYEGDEIILWGQGYDESDNNVLYYATYKVSPDGFFYYGSKDVVINQYGNYITLHGSYFYNVEFVSITTEPYTGYLPPEPWR